MPASAQIETVHKPSTDAIGGTNIRYSGLEWAPQHHAECWIHLFNVSQRNFERVGPYQNINIAGVREDDVALPGMAANERFHYVTSFSQPMLMPRFSDQSSEIGRILVDARRYVMDIVNPNNNTFSLDTHIRPEDVLSVNNDLSVKGVFFSLSDGPERVKSPKPRVDEVKKSIARMEHYYRGLLDRAQTLEMVDKPKLAEELGANPDYAYAATYYGKELSWNKAQVRPIECPGCHEQKPFGSKFHVNSKLGFVCIEPTRDGWMAAVQAGVKTREQVPAGFGFEWWLDDVPTKKS